MRLPARLQRFHSGSKMTRFLNWFCRIVLTSICVSAPLSSARAGDPDLVFHTIETEHFLIHYHQGLERIARQAATLCEEVHEEMSILYGWEVAGPIDVVVTDYVDSANGSAFVRHRPRIRLYVSAPSMERETQQYDHWMKTLIIHEYTHVATLQIHSGPARVINSIFGNVYLPNGVLTTWHREGIAVVHETHMTTGGRIRSAEYLMYLRTAALEGTLLSLSEVSNLHGAFPRGTARYLYGAMFYDYLIGRFGMDKMVQIYHRIGASLLPWGLNRIFKEVYGKPLDALYDEWMAHLIRDAQGTRAFLTEEGITESTRITGDGEYKGPPVFSADGKSVILSIENQDQRPGLFSVPVDGSARRLLALSSAWSPVSVDRSGRIFFTREAPFKNEYYYYDIFALDRPDSDPRRVTHGTRARSAAISPRGDLLAMAVNNRGTSKLVLADERGNPIRTLVDSGPEDQVYVPAWSPDQKKIAVVVRQGPRVDLVVIDVASSATKKVTFDLAIERCPNFDPTGRYLLFSSDRTRISNIYAYDLEEEQLLRLTNVITGAYFPAVSPDGTQLAFLQYSSAGYDLHLMPFAPQNGRPAEPVPEHIQMPGPLPEPSRAPAKPYNPLPSLLPKYWELGTSSGSIDNLQVRVLTGLSDAVGRHRAGIQVDYGVDSAEWMGRLAYSYRGLGPDVNLGGSYESRPRTSGYSVDGEAETWTQRLARGSFSLSFPIFGVDRTQNLSLGYSILSARPKDEPEVDLNPQEEISSVPGQYFRAGLEMGWSLTDVFTSAFGISPEQGRRLAAKLELYHPIFGGNQTLATFSYQWSEYILLPWLEHHVLAFRFLGGFHVSDPPGQASFSVGGYDEQNLVDAIWDANPVGAPSLRGYPYRGFEGDQAHSFKLEYRIPIWFPEAGYKTLPVYFKELHAAVFTDNALISFGELEVADWRSSVGTEMVWTLNLGYFLPVTFRLGYAYGFMDEGIHELVFVVGNAF